MVTQEQLQLPMHPAYFAVGPKPHQVTCPYCKANAMTTKNPSIWRYFSRRQYCAECGEYLGTYRRPQL